MSAPKKKVAPVLSDPVNRGRQSIHYVLTPEEREILFRGKHSSEPIDENSASGSSDGVPADKSGEKSALTCVLLLMFEELEHQPIVYEKLMSSDLFDGCLKNVSEDQTELVRKILSKS